MPATTVERAPSNEAGVDINPVTGPQLLEQLAVSWETRIPLFVVGGSGEGKTAMPYEWAREQGITCPPPLNFSDKGPQEVGGYGIPDHETREMWFSDPENLPTRKRVGDEHMLAILDELPNWDPQIAAMAHGALYAPVGMPRFIGSHEIGPNVRFLCTGNLKRHGARVTKLTIPQIARVIYVTLIQNPIDWVRWAQGKGYDDTYVPAFVHYHATLGEGASVLRTNPSEFDPNNPSPFACARAWENVCILRHHYGGGMRVGASERISSQGCWGPRAQLAFEGFLSVMDQLPSVEEAKNAMGKYVPPPSPEAQYALVAACLASLIEGVVDPEAETHTGLFDWFGELLLKCRGEIGRYGAEGAMRRGVAFDHREPYTGLLL